MNPGMGLLQAQDSDKVEDEEAELSPEPESSTAKLHKNMLKAGLDPDAAGEVDTDDLLKDIKNYCNI
jgi:hypothetical protein